MDPSLKTFLPYVLVDEDCEAGLKGDVTALCECDHEPAQ